MVEKTSREEVTFEQGPEGDEESILEKGDTNTKAERKECPQSGL